MSILSRKISIAENLSIKQWNLTGKILEIKMILDFMKIHFSHTKKSGSCPKIKFTDVRKFVVYLKQTSKQTKNRTTETSEHLDWVDVLRNSLIPD